MKSGILRFPHALEGHEKALEMALWCVQGVLAVLFGLAGVSKSFQPIAALAASMPWVADVPTTLVRVIGTLELLGAIGVLLPALTRILPQLTGIAALGLLADMVLATGFHLMRGEAATSLIPFCLGLLAAFVAWGRMMALPIKA